MMMTQQLTFVSGYYVPSRCWAPETVNMGSAVPDLIEIMVSDEV